MGFNGNDNGRGRPLSLSPVAPAFHYSNTPTRCSASTPAAWHHQNLTQNLRARLAVKRRIETKETR